VNQNAASPVANPVIAINAQGQQMVVWAVIYNGSSPFRGDLRARSISPAGVFGPEFQVNARTGSPAFQVVAPGAEGSFWVAWQEGDSEGPNGLSVRAQRVTPEGLRVGREIRVAPGHPFPHFFIGIASDRWGNFLVTWFQLGLEPENCGGRGRLYHADGRPVGKEFSLAFEPTTCESQPIIAFADNGTFAAEWARATGSNPNAEISDIFLTRFSVSMADEVCWERAGHLLCDTGRTGGEPEIDEPVAASSTSLQMGDVDGDGRADPCVFRSRELQCDLKHKGSSFSWRRPVTVPEGATLLLGDVDGDGKAEPCTWHAGSFRCESSEGSVPSNQFGTTGDIPLLGDINGDHRDDLCVFRGGQFFCDTGHDGGKPERIIVFGRPGDVPALGDFDGDGRDDPCVLRGHRVLCDTKHDGGVAEGKLAVAILPGEQFLIANLDGL
jgi:hypothetical protein